MKEAKQYSRPGVPGFTKDPKQLKPVKTHQVDRGSNIVHPHVPANVPTQGGLGSLSGETPAARNAKQNKHGGQK